MTRRQGRGIVHAVADHQHAVPGLFERLDLGEFVGGQATRAGALDRAGHDALADPLLTLLLRCRTMDEVKLLRLTLGLRAGAEGGQVVLAERSGKVLARAWLFD